MAKQKPYHFLDNAAPYTVTVGKQEIDLGELYRKKLGYVALPYPEGGIPDPRNLIPFGKYIGKGGKTMLGQPIRMPVRLRIPKQGEEWIQLPNEPIVSFENDFIIEKTSLNRGKKRGSVKEIINEDDWYLSLTGLIINEKNADYPNDTLSDMRRLFSYPGALQIDSPITKLLGITLVVRQKWTLPRTQDTILKVQDYTVTFLSDEDFELELK